jgi:putative endonuclease
MLRCADDTLYTGITTDLERRLREHNGELSGGAKATRMKRPVVLVWSEKHPSRSEASRREYAIKQLSRAEKSTLIAKRTRRLPDKSPR